MNSPDVLPADDPRALDAAISVLRRGGLVAIPTDTVYGLAADAWNGNAVTKLYAVKGRDTLKSIPVLVHSSSAIEPIAQVPSEQILAVARQFWPGPLTLVVERSPDLPSEISSTPTVGLRAPDQEFALKLLEVFGPLATTSANLSDAPSSISAVEVIDSLGPSIDLVVDGGEAAGGIPSSVIDLTVDPPELLRAGPIALESVIQVWESY